MLYLYNKTSFQMVSKSCLEIKKRPMKMTLLLMDQMTDGAFLIDGVN